MYSYGPPHMAVQKQDDQHEHTFSSYVRIRDVVLKTCLGRWTIRRSGERGSGISVLPARHDDDDDIFIIKYRDGEKKPKINLENQRKSCPQSQNALTKKSEKKKKKKKKKRIVYVVNQRIAGKKNRRYARNWRPKSRRPREFRFKRPVAR